MPELPDIELYIHALQARVKGQPLKDARLKSVFLLRTVEPSLESMVGRTVQGFRRIGKRIVFEMGDDIFMVFHLMISGRFQWKKVGAKMSARDLAAFDFEDGTLVMTEASKKKRAKLHIVRGEEALDDHDPGGIDPLKASAAKFGKALRARNHTVKRALTDPRIFSGIGNAYSDEILFEAKLPPHKWTSRLTDDEVRAAAQSRGRDPQALDQEADRRARWSLAQKGDGVSPRHEGARKVRRAVCPLWGQGSARVICE